MWGFCFGGVVFSFIWVVLVGVGGFVFFCDVVPDVFDLLFYCRGVGCVWCVLGWLVGVCGFWGLWGCGCFRCGWWWGWCFFVWSGGCCLNLWAVFWCVWWLRVVGLYQFGWLWLLWVAHDCVMSGRRMWVCLGVPQWWVWLWMIWMVWAIDAPGQPMLLSVWLVWLARMWGHVCWWLRAYPAVIEFLAVGRSGLVVELVSCQFCWLTV